MLPKLKIPSVDEGLVFDKDNMPLKSVVDQQPATFFQRLLARFVDNCIYFVFFVIILLVVLLNFGKYFFPADYGHYISFTNQLSVYLNDSSKSSTDIFSQAQTCSLTTIPESVKNINELCQNSRKYQIKVVYFTIWVMFFISSSYYILLTTLFQATLGKLILKIKVVSKANKRINFLQSLTREIFWILSGISGLMAIYIPSVDTLQTLMLIFIIAESSRVVYSSTHKSFHDTIAQTQVVRQ